MRRRSRKGAWSAGPGAWALSLALVVACSGSGKSFFDAPPLEHGGAGKGGSAGAHAAAGTSGKPTQSGSGGASGSAADGAGATSGDAGVSSGSPDDTGGAGNMTGNAGEQSTSGRGGSAPAGGASAGGATTSGGTGGVLTTGGSAGRGTGGDLGAGSGGLGGSSAGTNANGGLGAMAGLGGSGGLAGTGGSATCVPTVPADEICDGIDNDCAGGIDDQDVCPDGCIGAVYSGHRYLLCSGPDAMTYTRTAAHTACGDDGDAMGITLDLVRVNSAEEDAFLLGLLAEHAVSDDVWNGASDSSAMSIGSTEGTWVWGSANNGVTFYEDGAPVSNRYNDWADGQPDDNASGQGEDCAVFDADLDWQWNDVACSRDFPNFVCEEPTN